MTYQSFEIFTVMVTFTFDMDTTRLRGELVISYLETPVQLVLLEILIDLPRDYIHAQITFSLSSASMYCSVLYFVSKVATFETLWKPLFKILRYLGVPGILHHDLEFDMFEACWNGERKLGVQ